MNIYNSERPTTIKLPASGRSENVLNFRYFVPSSRQFYEEAKKNQIYSQQNSKPKNMDFTSNE